MVIAFTYKRANQQLVLTFSPLLFYVYLLKLNFFFLMNSVRISCGEMSPYELGMVVQVGQGRDVDFPVHVHFLYTYCSNEGHSLLHFQPP